MYALSGQLAQQQSKPGTTNGSHDAMDVDSDAGPSTSQHVATDETTVHTRTIMLVNEADLEGDLTFWRRDRLPF